MTAENPFEGLPESPKYLALPHDAQQLIAKGLSELIVCKERELTVIRQCLVVTRAVMQYPDTPERWPLGAPWPMGYVVWSARRGFRVPSVTRDRYPAVAAYPSGWSDCLVNAWTTPFEIHAKSVCIGPDMQVMAVADACRMVAEGTAPPTPEDS